MHDAKTEFPMTDTIPPRDHHQYLFQLLAQAGLGAPASHKRTEITADTLLLEAAFEIRDRAPGRSWIVWSA